MPLQTFQASEENARQRLDVFIAQNLSKIPSRTFVKKLIEAGQVRVNGRPQKASYKVEPGDRIELDDGLADQSRTIAPENIPINIFYEDPWLLIVNKPAGLLVHPVHGHHGGTLVNALMHHCKTLSDINTADDEGPFDPSLIRPGIVHRLDRETSGLLVVAKDNRTHVALARAFEKREVKKKYLALVKGRLEFDEGVIDADLGRHPRHRDKKAVVPSGEGKEAVTYYRVVKRFLNDATMVSLFPKSGRTHQLRVHMAHIGHPILGDDKYGEEKSFFRLALHAQSLGFFHPGIGDFIEFSTSVPSEFLAFGST